MSRHLLLTLLVLGLSWSTSVATALDWIQVRGQPTKLQGNITGDDLTGVSINIPGMGVQKFRQAEVEEIHYARAPQAYDWGVQAFKEGNYTGAIRQLETALRDRNCPQLLRQYIYYYKGESLFRLGKNKEAIETLETLLKEMQRTKFAMEAYDRLVQVCIAQEDWKKALQYAQQVERMDRVRGLLQKATIFEGRDDWRRAMQAYVQVQNKARRGDRRVMDMATLGKARCLVHMNQAKAAVKEVERLFDRLEDSGSSDALYAEGHLVLGNATREAARNASPVAREKALKEALLSYLRVQLLYGDIARPTAEALYRIGQCFSELGQQERAVAYWKQAAHRFGETNKWGIASMKKLQ